MTLLAAEEQSSALRLADIAAQLEDIAAGAHAQPDEPLAVRIARINHRLFDQLGFCGDQDHYDAPENSFIDQVLHRRKGLPILLSALYIEVARRVGITVVGVGFPSHYLVRPRDADFFIDPFHKGRILRPDQLRVWLSNLYRVRPIPHPLWEQATAIQSNQDLLVRMNRNLKFSYLRRDDLTGAVRAAKRLLTLDPEAAEERRDLGRLLLALGQIEDGMGELAHYLAERPTAPDAWQINQEIASCRRAPFTEDKS